MTQTVESQEAVLVKPSQPSVPLHGSVNHHHMHLLHVGSCVMEEKQSTQGCSKIWFNTQDRDKQMPLLYTIVFIIIYQKHYSFACQPLFLRHCEIRIIRLLRKESVSSQIYRSLLHFINLYFSSDLNLFCWLILRIHCGLYYIIQTFNSKYRYTVIIYLMYVFIYSCFALINSQW